MAGAYNQARLDVANHQANVRTQATAMENEKNNIAWNFVANSAEQLAELGAGAFNDHVDRKLEEYLSTQTEEVTDGYYYTVDDYGNRVINSSVDEVKKNAMANADEWINNNVGFGKDLLRKKIQRSVDLNTANYESQLKAKAISANTSAVENTKNKYLNNWDFSGTDVLELTKSIVDNYEVTMGKTFSVGDYGYNLYQDILNSSNDPNDAGNVFIKVAKLDIIMKAKSLNMSDSYIQSYMEGKQVEKELSLSYAAYSAVNDPTTGFIESVINSNYDQETAIAKYLGNEIDNVKKNGITDSNGNVIYLSEEELAAYETKVKSLYSTVITEWNYEAANAWEGISKGLEELYKNPDPYNNTELANITTEDEWANLIFSYAPQGMKLLSVENIKKTSWYKSLRPYAMEMIEGNKNYNLLIKAQNFNQKEFATPIARLTAWQEEIKGYSEQEKLLLSKLGAGDINVLYDDNYSDITRETFMSAYAPSLTAQFSSGMQSNLLEDVYNNRLAEERKLNLQNVENSVKQWVMSHPRFTLEELSNHLDTYNISELDKSIFYGAYLSTGQVNDFANKAVEYVSILFDLPEDKDGYKNLPPREEIEKAIDSIEEPVVKDYLNALYKADPSLYFLTGEEDEVLEKVRAVGVSYFGSNKTEFNNFIKENNDNIAAAIKAQSDYTWAKDFVSNEDKIKYGYLSTESEYVTPEELASYITINAVDSEGEDYDIGSDEYIEYISRTFFGEGKTFSEEELAELKDCTSEIEVKSFLMGAEGSQYNIQDAINVYTKYAEEDIPEEVKIMRDDAVKMAEYQMGRKALDNDVRNKKIHVGQASVSNSEYGKASLWTQKELNDAGENGALFIDIRNSLYETEYGSADYLLVQQKLQNNKYNLTKDAYDKLNALANSDLDSLAINMAKAFNIAGLENISIKEKLKEKYTASYGSNDFENFWEYMLNHNSSVIDKMGDAIKAYPDDAKSIDNFCTEIMVGYAASFAMHGTSTDRFNTITYDGNHFIVEDSIKKDSGTVKEVKHGWFGKEKVKDIETTPDNFYDALSTSINSKSYQGPSDYDKYLFSTVNKNDSRVAALFSMLETGTIPQYKDDKVSDRIITATAVEIATFMHTGHTNGLNVSKFGGEEYAGEISKQFYSLQRFYAENPTQSNAIMNTAAYIIQSYNSIFKDKSSLPQGLGNFYFDKDGRVYSYEKNCPLSYESDGLNATITHKDAATGEDTERIIALDMFRNDVKAKDVIQYIEIDSKYIAPINGSKVSMEGVLKNFSAIQEYNENCELVGSRLRLVPVGVASHLPEEYGVNEKMTYVKFKIVGLDDIDKYRNKDYWEKYNFESLISTSSRKGSSRNF